MKAKVILIKKYENRRMYDTVNSRYVNLEDVAKLLQNGHSVQVVDAISGQDITRLILTQIIVEDAKTPGSTFPVEVLRQMVVASGRATQAGAMLYMQAITDVYERSLRVLTPTYPSKRPPDEAESPVAPKPSERAEATGQPTPAEDSGDSIDELKRRLAELEGLVAALSPKAATR